ncbi:F-box-like domain superfamily [Arabidopsis suecica]|uniref:F-box-like domain superfamily n=1 Tax=Arabidopsis suecica TaxID=45249 RepID=A0A8T2BAJ7_ARASU|nr:F-box-like domain superfamily [Arabidopsis suecica]
MTLTISDLPRDLLEKEIFSRIPLKYVRALRLTCKEWETLIKSRSLTIEEEESQMIVLMDYNLCLMSISMNGGEPSTEIRGKLSCLGEQVKISQFFHCEGLLLCILKDDDTKVVVWNPYWGQTRLIQTRFFNHPSRWSRFNYALGYYKNNNKMKSSKLLRFLDYFYISRGLTKEKNYFWYEIYDFDSGLWTTLDVTPHWLISFDERGVSLKENTYWCARERNPRKPCHFLKVDHIICFDFTSERFGPLLRLPFRATRDSLWTLSCVREEKLAALFCHEYVVEVWITTRIEANKVSWSKFLTFDVGEYYPMINPGARSVFVDEVNKVAMIFDKTLTYDKTLIIGEAGYVRYVDLGEPAHRDS